MKKAFLTLASVLFFFAAFAQDTTMLPEPPSFTQEQDSAFGPLDKSRIPSGILYNRVFQFAHLDQLQEGDTLTFMHWVQGVSELERARYAGPLSDSLLNPRNIQDFLRSENKEHRLATIL